MTVPKLLHGQRLEGAIAETVILSTTDWSDQGRGECVGVRKLGLPFSLPADESKPCMKFPKSNQGKWEGVADGSRDTPTSGFVRAEKRMTQCGRICRARITTIEGMITDAMNRWNLLSMQLLSPR